MDIEKELFTRDWDLPLKDRLSEDLKSAMRGASSDPEQRIRLSIIHLLNAKIKL